MHLFYFQSFFRQGKKNPWWLAISKLILNKRLHTRKQLSKRIVQLNKDKSEDEIFSDFLTHSPHCAGHSDNCLLFPHLQQPPDIKSIHPVVAPPPLPPMPLSATAQANRLSCLLKTTVKKKSQAKTISGLRNCWHTFTQDDSQNLQSNSGKSGCGDLRTVCIHHDKKT